VIPEGSVSLPELTNSIVFPTVINETMRKAFWPNQDPIGQMFSPGNVNGPWRQVVGVVSDIRQRGLASRPAPEACDLLDGSSNFFLMLGASLPPATVTAEARRVVEQLDAGLPLFSVRTLDQVIDDYARRFYCGLPSPAAIGIGVSCWSPRRADRRCCGGADRRRVLNSRLARRR
jgi:hypothetical protein